MVLQSTIRALTALLLAACGTGCAGDSVMGNSVERGAALRDDNEAGGPLPQQFTGERYPGRRRPLTVRVYVAANGCFLGAVDPGAAARTYLVVWPAGSESAGAQIRLPDGTMVGHGDRLAGQGALMPTAELAGVDVSSFWGHIVGFCDQDAERVLVLDSVTSG
jgi:hypothetical protein